MDSIATSTLKSNLCISCAICKIVCPCNAIKMLRKNNLEISPIVDYNKCNKCGLCATYCPNTKAKMRLESEKFSKHDYPVAFGLDNARYYLGWNRNDAERILSASGGVITKLATHLLNHNIINGVVHAERLFAQTGKPHYQASLSTTSAAISSKASSIYAPIAFDDVLQSLESGKTYLLIATPCIIRACQYLFTQHPQYGKIKIISCALICSHNVNEQLDSYFADMHKLPHDVKYAINMRNKDNIPDANNFNNHFYTQTKDLLKINRNSSGWTKLWRNYYFAMNCCNYCSDFWGYKANFSVKDAWGHWAIDPLGKSIVVVRDPAVSTWLKEAGLMIEALDYDKMKDHQQSTSIFKQKEAYNKNHNSIYTKANRRNKLFSYVMISRSSKMLYQYWGWRGVKVFMPILRFTAKLVEKF